MWIAGSDSCSCSGALTTHLPQAPARRTSSDGRSAPRRSGTPTRDPLPPSIGRSGGTSSRHRSRPCERKQRGWNAQPGGRLMSDGGCPGIGRSHSSSSVSFGSESMRPIVYGCLGFWKIVCTSPCSTILPPYITITRSHSSATMPRSCVIRIVAASRLRLHALQHLEHLRLDRHVERRRRLVRDQERRRVRDRHRDHRALAHAARELVRIVVVPRVRVRDADEPQQLDHARPSPCRSAPSGSAS